MTVRVSDAVLMTLAGIAYGSPALVQRHIDEAAPTTGDWSVVWLAAPPDPPVNFAFLATCKSSGASVIAIRGTYPDPFSAAYWDDGNQDSPFGDMVEWAGAPDAKISAGTSVGLAGVLALVDAAGKGLADAVAALADGAALIVTGHSLGGTLAPVLALALAEKLSGRPISAVSFAGMTPGNAAFAALFGSNATAGVAVRRVYNTLDTVSYGWDKVFATHDFYQPAPQGGVIVAALLLATAARLEVGGYDFTAVGDDVPLTGVLNKSAINCSLVAYVLENLHQHMPDTYLALLGAPPLPFSILFGTIIAPRDHPTAIAAREMPVHQLPVAALT